TLRLTSLHLPGGLISLIQLLIFYLHKELDTSKLYELSELIIS
ncbi:hypothetical protein GGD38_005064, partial [Chitinophagaceae bacterium OAS944]|nr:hypothetical protein [Chitinophagaceae bacterium OAS944]